MSAIIGIALTALCFGAFTVLRARDRGGCTGGCVGCTGQGHCERNDRETTDATYGAKP